MEFCPDCSFKMNIVDNLEEYVRDFQKGGSKGSESLLEKILEGSKTEEFKEIPSKVLINIVNTEDYKKLRVNKQEYVFNFIQELLPSGDKEMFKENKITSSSSIQSYYYYCAKCSFFSKIPPKTLLIKKNYKVKSVYEENYSHHADNPILPRISDYTCVNDKCATNQKGELKEDEEKEAVFMRDEMLDRIVYICRVCRHVWFK